MDKSREAGQVKVKVKIIFGEFVCGYVKTKDIIYLFMFHFNNDGLVV